MFGRFSRSVLAAVVSASGGSAWAAPRDPVPLEDVARQYHLELSRDPATGVVFCAGKGLRVTAGPGLSMVLLNGEGVALDRPLVEEGGRIQVPWYVVEAIRVRAGAAEAPAPARGSRELDVVVARPRPAAPAWAIAVGDAAAQTALMPPPGAPTTRPSPPATDARPARPSGPVQPVSRSMTVVLDAGHGGVHTGAQARSGLTEKDINLDVARRLQRRLEAAGVVVIMTRTEDAAFSSDRNEDLRRRFDLCNRSYPDLFLSVHSNWAESASARGFEVYVRREHAEETSAKERRAGAHPIPPERMGGVAVRDVAVQRLMSDLLIDRSAAGSRILAREIEGRFKGGLATEDRGVKEQDFQVIRWSNCPAVLVELEFLSNRRGERDLSTPAYREKLAELLAESVLAFRARWAS